MAARGTGQSLCNDDEQWLATQTLVWEFVTGCRNATGSFEQVDTKVYSLHFGENQPNSGARAVYDQIVSLLQRHHTVPSFMNGGHIDLEYQDGKYTATLTDTNGVLSEYDFTSSDSSVAPCKTGNTSPSAQTTPSAVPSVLPQRETTSPR